MAPKSLLQIRTKLLGAAAAGSFLTRRALIPQKSRLLLLENKLQKIPVDFALEPFQCFLHPGIFKLGDMWHHHGSVVFITGATSKLFRLRNLLS